MTRLEKIQWCLDKGFVYNPQTGVVYGSTGKPIIRKTANGYIRLPIYFNGKRHTLIAHQFAWYWVYQETVYCIDHIDNDKINNRISNLRSVTKSQNACNIKKDVGASFSQREQKWIASITVNYKSKQLGTFSTKEEALECYKQNKNKYHKI